MSETIDLLKEKNSYLEKFVSLNREWLGKLNSDDFSNIETYRENREQILNILKHLDKLIDESAFAMKHAKIEKNDRDTVSGLLNQKNNLVKAILHQDLDIMQIIEEAKSSIITELKQTAKEKNIAAYKTQDP